MRKDRHVKTLFRSHANDASSKLGIHGSNAVSLQLLPHGVVLGFQGIDLTSENVIFRFNLLSLVDLFSEAVVGRFEGLDVGDGLLQNRPLRRRR